MPKKPAVPPNEMYEALKEMRFLDNEGKLLPLGNNVWQEASDALHRKMSKDYVYLHLSQNRQDVFRRIHGAEALDSSNATLNGTNDVDTTMNDSGRDPNWSMGDTECVLPPLNNHNITKRMGRIEIVHCHVSRARTRSLSCRVDRCSIRHCMVALEIAMSVCLQKRPHQSQSRRNIFIDQGPLFGMQSGHPRLLFKRTK